jgi:hypothetical protein
VLAGASTRWQVGQRPVGHVGEDPLPDGVVAVLAFGLDQQPSDGPGDRAAEGRGVVRRVQADSVSRVGHVRGRTDNPSSGAAYAGASAARLPRKSADPAPFSAKLLQESAGLGRNKFATAETSSPTSADG